MNPITLSPTTLLYGILNENAPLPDHMEVGTSCINGHGLGGKGVRYKKNGMCIACCHEAGKERRRQGPLLKRDMTALQVYERLQEARELASACEDDPLFN